MRARSYYRRWAATAFLHSIGPIDLWAGLGGAGLAAIDHFMPERQLVNTLAWQAPLWAALAVVLFRIVAAPFWMAKEDAEKVTALEAKIASKEERQRLREALGSFLIEGRQLQERCSYQNQDPPNAEADAWAGRVETFLGDNLDSGHIARFRDGSDLPMGANSIGSIPHRQLWGGLRVRLARLSQFIAEIPI
jgi:hypothetical protein